MTRNTLANGTEIITVTASEVETAIANFVSTVHQDVDPKKVDVAVISGPSSEIVLVTPKPAKK